MARIKLPSRRVQTIISNMVRTWLFGIWFFVSVAARGETVFEGYYRVEDAGTPVGFAVAREEFDAKSGVWTIRSFIHTFDREHKLHEVSAVSRNDRDFH